MNTRKAIGQKKKRGFSLIEIAIYLGVVALVVGGIWSAASGVREGWKTTQHIGQLQYIISSTLKLFKGVVLSDISGTYIDDTLIAAGAIPQDMIKNGSNSPSNPWGGSVGGFVTSDKRRIAIATRDLDFSVCTNIFFGIGSKYKDRTVMTDIVVDTANNTTSQTFSVPLTITPESSPCYKDQKSKIFFYLTP
jgi:hypothetical protein